MQHCGRFSTVNGKPFSRGIFEKKILKKSKKSFWKANPLDHFGKFLAAIRGRKYNKIVVENVFLHSTPKGNYIGKQRQTKKYWTVFLIDSPVRLYCPFLAFNPFIQYIFYRFLALLYYIFTLGSLYLNSFVSCCLRLIDINIRLVLHATVPDEFLTVQKVVRFSRHSI